MIGHGAVILGHEVISKRNQIFTRINKINIKDNVTLGVYSIIMSGVHIGKNSIVQANSLVLTGTKIPENEIWGGNPAKFIKKRNI